MRYIHDSKEKIKISKLHYALHRKLCNDGRGELAGYILTLLVTGSLAEYQTPIGMQFFS